MTVLSSGPAAVLVAALSALAAALAVPQGARPGPSSAGAGARTRPRRAGPPASQHPRRLRVVLAVAAAAGVALVVGGWLGPLLGLPAGGFAWRLLGTLEPASARRRRERLERDLPLAVDLLSACVAAGSSLTAAVRTVGEALDGPMAEELVSLAGRFDLGEQAHLVWSRLAEDPALAPLGRPLARAAGSGASVSGVMDRLGEDLRRDARAEVENKARTVGVRAAVPLGVCLLPAFVLLGVVPLVVGSVGMLLVR